MNSIFTPEEPGQLARLIQRADGTRDVTCQAIDLPDTDKNECILLAYENRLLIPRTTMPGSVWQIHRHRPGLV